MRLLAYGLRLTVFALIGVPAAYGNCYLLENRTSSPIKLEFTYSAPPGLGAVTAVELVPNGRYPARGEWCWNTRADQWAKVTVVTSVPHRASWEGQLVMGNGGPAYPSGRYVLLPPNRDNDDRPRRR